jgi:hypothetical protein
VDLRLYSAEVMSKAKFTLLRIRETESEVFHDFGFNISIVILISCNCLLFLISFRAGFPVPEKQPYQNLNANTPAVIYYRQRLTGKCSSFDILET